MSLPEQTAFAWGTPGPAQAETAPVEPREQLPLDRVPVTAAMRKFAAMNKVVGDDDAIRRWHAEASRRAAEASERLHAEGRDR